MKPFSLLMVLGPQAAAQDTLVVVAARDGLDIIFAFAAGAIALTFFAVLFTIIMALREFARVERRLGKLGERIAQDPGIESLRNISANLESISASVRDEAERLTASVGKLSERLTQASDRMEERIEEFNALMEVVQSEAERAFVDTAATARGVRKGLGEVGRAARKGNPDPGSRDPDGPSTPASRPADGADLPLLDDPEEVERP
jgi:methyl-accepting chemotaxis protein